MMMMMMMMMILLKLDFCPSDRSYLVHFARSTPFPLTRLPRGDDDTAVLPTAAAARITAIPYQLLQQQAGRGATLQHDIEDSVGMLALTHRLSIASRCLHTSYVGYLFT